MIEINKELSISQGDLSFVFSRSSGPGGQNVNKVSTRATLLFNIDNCPTLSETQKHLLHTRLAKRIDSDGLLRVTCQDYRTQSANRRGALLRFVELLVAAMKRKPPRKKTRPSQAARKKRMENKKRRGDLKQQRAKPSLPDNES
jgi:ribosome-associated protein